MRKGTFRVAALATGGLAACGLALLAPVAARAETLSDAIALAYQTNPTLQSQRAQLRAIDESYVQARSALRPQASISAEADYVNGPGTRSEGGLGPPVANWPDSATINLSQLLFSGGQVSAEMRATLADILSARQKLRQTEAAVLLSVVQAYVTARRDAEALSIAQDNVTLLKRQLEETNARYDVHEITKTDVAQAEARLAAAQAQLSTAWAQLGVTRSNYLALVGQNPGELAPEPPLAGLPATVDEAFAVADKNNPSIVAADYEEQAAAARVVLAKAGYRPTVSVRASYGFQGYLANQQKMFPQQVAGAYQQSISASAVFTQPLFTGGMNSSRVRQALETDNAARIDVEYARRQAVQSVAQAWNQLLAARANVESATVQVKSNELAYEGVKKEAQVGTRETIEVLNAEQELEQAKLAQINARHDQYVAGASALAAMGMLEARFLAPTTQIYEPQTAFKRARDQGGLPGGEVVEAIDAAGGARVRTPPPAPPPVLPPPFALRGRLGE